jgi:beta-glucosidase
VSKHLFPDGFTWGTATSSQQIEGAVDVDGRGKSIWDHFAGIPGKIKDGSNADLACDHYHRWPEDIEQLKWLGLDAYRFSIAWPRILPQGRGQINAAGLDFYERLVDGLLAANIEPFPTLYHWDLPQALQDRGGWANRETTDAFCEYTEAVTRRLGDRVSRWVTHNEPWCIACLGHEEGAHAPGHKNPAEALVVAHHILLSHGKAVPIIRREVKNAEVGIVQIHCPSYPLSDSAGDLDAARWFDGFFNRWFMDPIYKGSYPADVIADRIAAGHLESSELPFVKKGDMDLISAPLDFLGLNYYSRNVMRKDDLGKRVAVPMVPKEEQTDMGWEVYAAGFLETMMSVNRDYRPEKIYITENGAAYDYPITDEGRIVDTKRIAYFQDHLKAVHQAIEFGVPIKGYFAWSQMDNFEWALGYEKKFGLYEVNRETLDRTPKDSAYWYRDVVATNTVDDEHTPNIQGESRVLDA